MSIEKTRLDEVIQKMTQRDYSKADVIAATCSDARMHPIREFLEESIFEKSELNIMTYSTAGNIAPPITDKPTIIIGHGNSNRMTGCGAIDYVAIRDDIEKPKFQSFYDNIIIKMKKVSIENENPININNILGQIFKISKEFREGAFYYNHVKGNVDPLTSINTKTDYMKKIFNAFENLPTLTNEESNSNSKGQYPELLVFGSNIEILFDIPNFRVDSTGNIGMLQLDSIKYAVSHALKKDNESFYNSGDLMIGINNNNNSEKIVSQANELIHDPIFKSYANRGGKIHMVHVKKENLLDHKKNYVSKIEL